MFPSRNRLLRGVAPILVAGVSAVAVTSAPASATAPPAVAPAPRSVTLVTGERVTMSVVSGHPVFATTSPSGRGVAAAHFQSAGDYYVVPAEATPYLGRGLDPSLFDVSALLRDRLTGGARIPVTLSFGSGVTPAAPPGVAMTSASGGFVTTASAARLVAGVRRTIGADIRAGRPAGTTALFGGLSSMRLAAPGGIAPAVTPHYALHTLQINATDLAGAPADAFVTLINTDSLRKEHTELPISAGIGRIQVPSGDYAAEVFFTDFDGQGDTTAAHLVILNDFTVPDTSGVTTTENMAEAAASARISATTPRPATAVGLSADWYREDATGAIFADGFVSFADEGEPPLYVNPQPAAKVGKSHYLVQWQGTGPSTGPRYQYSVAFASDDIPADETYKVLPDQLATVHTSIYGDPANSAGSGTLLSGVLDSFSSMFGGGVGVRQPTGALTWYVGTADGGRWAQIYAGPTQSDSQGDDAWAQYQTDPVTLAAGHDYQVQWAHGPLAPSYGQHTGSTSCAVCVAGGTLSIGYGNVIGDSEPDHTAGLESDGPPPGTFHLTVDQNGTQVYDQTGPTVTDVTGVPTVPTTYREVFDADLSGVPGVSQSTETHTDLSFRYDPAHPGVALPAEDSCDGQSAGTPCWIQPVLSLRYCLTTDFSNTSDLSTQTMGLRVGHLGYDGQGSHAAITAASVAVSFDGGTTWRPASLTGRNGVYTATWSNPASADATKPELKVTATDAAGGAITQTVTDAYSIA